MESSHTRQPTGQSVIEYALLFGLLLVVIASILVITGPGIGNVYNQVMGTGQSEQSIADELAGEKGILVAADECGSIMILGDIRFNLPGEGDGNNGTGTFILGGKSNCSLVVGSGAGMSDPLVFEPTRYPPRIDCVEIDDFVVGHNFLEDMTRTFFSLESTPLDLRITDGAGGPSLFTATLQPDHLVVEKSAIVVRGDLAGVRVEDTTASPTLVAFGEAENAAFHLVIRSRNMEEASSASDLTLDRSPLQARSGSFTLTLIAECN